MRNPHPKLYNLSIVLLGQFNPSIFHPIWFGAENLLRKEEVDAAKIDLVHPDITKFTLDWLTVEVLRERFVIQTMQETYDEALRDLALGTFSVLRHTPITKMGINRSVHFLIESEEKWHAAGDKLAPKVLWTGILEKPGMRSLTMEESSRKDGLKGCVRVRIEPSATIQPGLFIEVNDHMEFSDPKKGVGSEEMLDILKSTWKDSIIRAEDIIYTLYERALS